jgi:hypothetical protein
VKDEDDMTPHPRRPFAAPVDARAAAVRLEHAADAMRTEQLERRAQADEPPTGLLDLAAIRAALGSEPGGVVNPAAVRWLAGEDVEQLVADEVERTGQEDDYVRAELDRQWSELDHVEPEHTHPYFVEGCAECVTRAEQLEALEDDARMMPEPCRGCGTTDPTGEHHIWGERKCCPDCDHRPEPVEPEPVVVEPVEAPGSPVPAPVPAVPPSTPAPVVDVVPVVFSSEHPRLTWRSRHDPRSRQYGVRRLMVGSAPVTDHVWPVGPVLDQGTEGACVGFGVVDAVNAARAGDNDLDADVAYALYRRAQKIDDVPGEAYTGTSVLAGMQAALEHKLIGGYSWAFGTRDVAQAVLQVGPVIVGVPWLAGMYDTGPGGLVELNGADTGAGHCLAVVGLKVRGPQGQLGPYFVWQNSWGPGYGDRGLGYIHHRDLATLLHSTGEAAIPTRAAQHV